MNEVWRFSCGFGGLMVFEGQEITGHGVLVALVCLQVFDRVRGWSFGW